MIFWHEKELIEKVKNAAELASKYGAEAVAVDAKRILMARAKHPTGKLAAEIRIKTSKFKAGGFIVQAQGPGNYTRFYATFVEMGTHKMQAVPFLRPALKRNRSKILKNFDNILKS